MMDEVVAVAVSANNARRTKNNFFGAALQVVDNILQMPTEWILFANYE
jgi:hypothetical protein